MNSMQSQIETIYSTMEILWNSYGRNNEELNEQLYDLMLDVETILDFTDFNNFIGNPLSDAINILNEANELINSKK